MSAHDELLLNYVSELTLARDQAEQWWRSLQADSLRRHGSEDLAASELRRRWPDGPASHPCVLTVVRKYWLLCDALNRLNETAADATSEAPSLSYVLAPSEDPFAGETADDVEPFHVDARVFVLEWLMDGDHEALALFLSTLSYWPIGLDFNDAYV